MKCGRVLRLTVDADLIPGFFEFLQKGVTVKAPVGCSVKAFLCDQLGLSPDYVEKRVQTCFLDGKAVDDMNTAMIKTGATLSLSGALPGLLGATLRKGSFYASMRTQISHQDGECETGSGEGEILLKLFNLVTREIGPELLRQGVRVQGRDLEDFFKRQGNFFWSRCKAISIDDEKAGRERLAGLLRGTGEVLLSLRAA
ncbi:MAG: hypothetical protein ABII06_09595 [Pseudomonadota bacterium]